MASHVKFSLETSREGYQVCFQLILLSFLALSLYHWRRETVICSFVCFQGLHSYLEEKAVWRKYIAVFSFFFDCLCQSKFKTWLTPRDNLLKKQFVGLSFVKLCHWVYYLLHSVIIVDLELSIGQARGKFI